MAAGRRGHSQPVADWSAHVPPGSRQRVLWGRFWRGLLNRLTSRRSRVLVLTLLYVTFCLVIWRATAGTVALLAILPLLLTPALALLVYWLVWSEFHR